MATSEYDREWSAGDVPAGVPDEKNYQAVPAGYGPDGAGGQVGDPYGQWRGGRFVPGAGPNGTGTVYQTTPMWRQSLGPFSIGPFSGDGWGGSPYQPPYMDYAYTQFDMPSLPALMGPDPAGPDRGYTPELLESYAQQFGAFSAPITPTAGSPASLAEASSPLGSTGPGGAAAPGRPASPLAALYSLFRPRGG